MNVLAHITIHEVVFVVAVFAFGLAGGYLIGWKRFGQRSDDREGRR